MADPQYQEGDMLYNPTDGSYITLQNGAWQKSDKPVPPPPSSGKIAQPPGPDVSIGSDLAQSAGPELERGLVGLGTAPTTLADLGAKGVGWAANKVLPEGNKVGPAMDATDKFLQPFTYGNVQQKIENAQPSGHLYSPQTETGKFAGSVLQSLPAALVGDAPILSKVATAVGSGIGSEAAGEGAEAMGAGDYSNMARMVGALKGGKLAEMPRKVVTPYPGTQAQTDLGDLIRQKGGDNAITAGQYSGNPALLQKEGNLIGKAPAPYSNLDVSQPKTITQMLMGEQGAPGQDASRSNVQAAGAKIGTKIEDLRNNTQMDFDQPFVDTMKDARDTYYKETGIKPDPNSPSPVDNRINELLGNKKNTMRGGLKGTSYGDIRSQISQQAQDIYATDPAASRGLQKLRDGLDDNMERSLTAQNSPYAGQWKTAFDQWEAHKAISKVANKPNSPPGILDPKKVNAAVKDPDSEIGKLSYAAASIPKIPAATEPKSGGLVGSMLGMLLGHLTGSVGGPTEAGILGNLTGPGIMDAMTRNKTAAGAMFSPTGQKYLSNQRWLPGPGSTMDPSTARLISLLQAGKGSSDQQ